MRRRGGVVDGLLGLLVLLGVPVVLWQVVGLELPQFPRTLATATTDVGLAAWIAWGWCATGLAIDVVRRVQEPGRHSRSPRFLEPLAAGIVSLLLGTATVLPGTAAFASGSSATSAAATASPSTAPAASTATPRPLSSYPAVHYVVQSGDNLWSIAARLYGDGDSWQLLAAANLGATMSDGRVFVDPNLIFPGWVLSAPVPGPPPANVHGAVASATAPLMEQARLATGMPAHQTHRADDISSALFFSSALGTSIVAATLALRRRRRRGITSQEPTMVDLDVALERIDASPLASLTEAAILLAEADGALTEVSVLLVDEEGAHLRSSSSVLWRSPTRDLVSALPPPLVAPAIVVPLGATEGGELSLVVPAHHHILVGGPGADDLVAQMLELQHSFIWGSLVVRSDPTDTQAAHVDGEANGLHVSDDLDLGALGATVIAAGGVDDADVILGDATLQMPRFGIEMPWEPLPSFAVPPAVPERAPDHMPADPDNIVEYETTASTIVRLMASQPRLEGLAAPLDPKRARRATELVAYLALHAPDQVTGDRIRTRVLGSSDRDAATKTLFNVASAARRSLGMAPDGSPKLPPATRNGCYQSSPSITTDLALLEEHLGLAEATSGDAERIAHLRAAIELVESEPLSAVLAGWEWFTPEGHRARMEHAVESVAISLALAAAAAGLDSLVALALERARLVLPFSERLAIAAMEAASLLGDVDGVRKAFDDLGILVDHLEPGSWPVPELEDRFVTLRQNARRRAQASLAAIDEAPRSTSPSAPAAL